MSKKYCRISSWIYNTCYITCISAIYICYITWYITIITGHITLIFISVPMLFTMPLPFCTNAIYHAIYHLCFLPCYIICYIGLPPMLSTILYTTYSVYHARMGGVAVLDEVLDKFSIGLFLPGEVFYNTLAGSENLKTRSLPQAAIHTMLYTMLYTILYRI